jgi:TonB-linked SusC/RagA family outer membrane protein
MKKTRQDYARNLFYFPQKLTLRLMLAMLLLAVSSIQIQAKNAVGNEKISMERESTSVKLVLKEIERQSDLRFFFNTQQVDVKRTVSVHFKGLAVSDAIQEVFEGTTIQFKFYGRQILLYVPLASSMQDVVPSQASSLPDDVVFTISGLVSDDQNQPLPGANILEKGTTTGTTTDSNGEYKLNVSDPNATLVYSFIGYTSQEIPINNQTVINVSLQPDVLSLSEVVVVGYGTQKKTDLTGSISTIKGEALVAAPMPNLANALTGKMTGVITTQQSGKPGFDDPTFLIRGKSTFGDNGALVLVDGIERSVNRIDPNEIESITILKDAASAAVYGARAANGVVLVTTKRGSETAPNITYTMSAGSQSPTTIPSLMNAYDYARYLNIARANSGAQPVFSDSEIQQYEDGTLPSTDWWNASLKKRTAMWQHNLIVDGGSKISKYFISLGYLDQGGLYELSNFKRYNLRANIDTKITDNFNIGFDVAGRLERRSQSAAGDGVFSTVINSYPTEPAYVPPTVDEGGLNSNGQSTSPIGQALFSGYDRTSTNVFQGTLRALYNFPFIKGLSAKLNYSYDHSSATNKVFNIPYTFYIHNKAADTYSSTQSSALIALNQGYAEAILQTLQTSLIYDKAFKKHTIAGLLLFERILSQSQDLTAYRQGFLSPAIDQLFAGGDLNKTNGGSSGEFARMGYVGRVNYNYAEKYLFQANFRYDGSSNFPSDKRWGFFPAVSAGWRIHEEPFMANVGFITNLKLRASWGQYGNDRVPPFQYLSGFNVINGAYIGSGYQKGINDTGIPNPNITWETATNTDIGFEFGVINEKITGEIVYFTKETKDILLPRNASVPSTFGATLPYENIGIVNNKGVEAALMYRDQAGSVAFSVQGNMTYTKNKVEYMDEPADVDERIRRTGQPFDQYYGLKAIGLFQSQAEIDNAPDQDGTGNATIHQGDIKYLDFDNDGKVDGLDIHHIGKNDIPQVIFGLNLTADYKGFGLTANFQGATGFQQYLRWDPFNLNSNALNIFKDSWTPETPEAKYPALYNSPNQNNTKESSFWLYDGTYVRLRNLELAYTFNTLAAFQKIGIKSLRVFASGNNLFTISKLKDFDPEAPNIDPGRSSFYYPQLKTMSLGLSVKF